MVVPIAILLLLSLATLSLGTDVPTVASLYTVEVGRGDKDGHQMWRSTIPGSVGLAELDDDAWRLLHRPMER